MAYIPGMMGSEWVAETNIVYLKMTTAPSLCLLPGLSERMSLLPGRATSASETWSFSYVFEIGRTSVKAASATSARTSGRLFFMDMRFVRMILYGDSPDCLKCGTTGEALVYFDHDFQVLVRANQWKVSAGSIILRDWEGVLVAIHQYVNVCFSTRLGTFHSILPKNSTQISQPGCHPSAWDSHRFSCHQWRGGKIGILPHVDR